MILLANSTFEGTFYFSQAPKMADIPHGEEKNDLFSGIFPHFLNSPTISYYGDYIRLKAGGTTSAPTGDTTLALGFPAGSSGTTGDVIFVMPAGSSSYTLMLLDTPSTQYAQASANFQVG